jgi:hypothetical protein
MIRIAISTICLFEKTRKSDSKRLNVDKVIAIFFRAREIIVKKHVFFFLMKMGKNMVI